MNRQNQLGTASALVVVAVLLSSPLRTQAQLTNCFGILGGGVRVVQDNYIGTTGNSGDNWGWMLALNRAIPIAFGNSLSAVIELSFRESVWDRYYRGAGPPTIIDPFVRTLEFAFSPMLVHSPPRDRARVFVHSGPEISWVMLSESPYSYDETHWNDIGLSMVFGGGILIPAGDKEIVIDVRYNTDITEAVDDSGRLAPVGSRFDELHLLLGVNLPVEFFRLRN